MRRGARSRGTVLVARGAVTALVVAASAACARAPRRSADEPAPLVGTGTARVARVSLETSPSVTVGATGPWQLVDALGRVLARGDSSARASVGSSNGVLRLQGQVNGAGGDSLRTLSLIALDRDAFVSVNGRRYRGELVVTAGDSGVHVVNRVPLEAYLRGVVPRELGTRAPSDRAALEAQAIAARSYALVRLGASRRSYDLVASVNDQVYGGVDAENPEANAAIAATQGLVLTFEGRIVSAPYHSTCGGSTAQPEEVWRSRSEPFLQRVSDRIPGTDRYYCDIAPRFRWERSWRADSLTAVVGRYVRAYARVPAGGVGTVRSVTVDGHTESGRVAALVIDTDSGRITLRANDIRYVLRSAGGELLNSTYFSPEPVTTPAGRLERLTIRGRGYGHGVGMCQWGAIGRARAGQDSRTILGTYFPGTRLARAY